ncbi:MAG: hypothetical protein ABR968_06125 [Bacteroidales bacterium]|jgi:hypothetical protein
MKTKTPILVLIFFASVILLFTHCTKEGKNLGTLSFTTQDHQIVPYHGGEQLTFKDSLGRLANMSVKSPISDVYNKALQNSNISSNYYTVETVTIKADSIFTISLSFSYPFNTPEYKIFSVNFGFLSHPEIGYFTGLYQFNSGAISVLPTTSSSPVAYYDSLTIVSRKFYDVYGLSTTLNPGTSDYITTVFYTVSIGFVGVKTNKGEKWYLD